MAKKKNKKKTAKKKDLKKKEKKKGLKKLLKKKDQKKEKKEKREKRKKKDKKIKKKAVPQKAEKLKKPVKKEVETQKSPAVETQPVIPATGSHSSDYNVREANKIMRTLKSKEKVLDFVKGEERLTVTRVIPAVLRHFDG